jgi:hypothetical protein
VLLSDTALHPAFVQNFVCVGQFGILTATLPILLEIPPKRFMDRCGILTIWQGHDTQDLLRNCHFTNSISSAIPDSDSLWHAISMRISLSGAECTVPTITSTSTCRPGIWRLWHPPYIDIGDDAQLEGNESFNTSFEEPLDITDAYFPAVSSSSVDNS